MLTAECCLMPVINNAAMYTGSEVVAVVSHNTAAMDLDHEQMSSVAVC